MRILPLLILMLFYCCSQKKNHNTKMSSIYIPDTIQQPRDSGKDLSTYDTTYQLDLDYFLYIQKTKSCFYNPKTDSFLRTKFRYVFGMDHSEYNEDSLLKTMTLQDKLYYSLYYPSSYTQICSSIEPLKKENKIYIYGYPSQSYGGNSISEKQLNSLTASKEKCNLLLLTCYQKNGLQFDSHLLTIMLALESKELVLAMSKRIDRRQYYKYTEIFTLMMLLMKERSFEAFKKTSIYKSLYELENTQKSRIEFTIKNVNSIINLFTAFVNSDQKK